MSNKDNDKHLVGQPVFRQLLNLIPSNLLERVTRKHKSDRYYKTFDTRIQLITMLFGIFSRCDSMGEVCDNLRALGGKLNHLDMRASPAKSTAGDGLRGRPNEVFKELYFLLLELYKPLLSVSRLDNVSFSKLFIFDSTTIRLFSEVMKGVGRNPKGEGRKKGGLKVHMMIDAHSQTSTFVTISEAKEHDKNFLRYLTLAAYSMVVFDRAYNYYLQFAEWTKKEISFVCRLKVNAIYTVEKEVFKLETPCEKACVLKEEIIIIKYTDEDKEVRPLRLRKVTYQDDKKRIYEFITNNFAISSEEVAAIYKHRWNIEILFKKLKQNFQLHYFYSETENGIKTQIWCTLIAQLLLQILKVKSKSKKAFSNIASLVRVHLTSYMEINWMVENCRRSYAKTTRKKNKSPSYQTEMSI